MYAHRTRAIPAFPQVPLVRLAPAANAAAGGLSIAQSLVPPLIFFYRKQWRSGTLATGATEGVRIPTVETDRIPAARAGLSRVSQYPSTDVTALRAVAQAPGDHRAPNGYSEYYRPDFDHPGVNLAQVSRAGRRGIARQPYIPAQYSA